MGDDRIRLWWAIQDLFTRRGTHRKHQGLTKVTVKRPGEKPWVMWTVGDSVTDDLRIALYAAAVEAEQEKQGNGY